MAAIITDVNSLTLTLDGQIIDDFISGDVVEIAYVNDSSSHVIATNGGVNIQKRTDGDVANLTMRLLNNTESDVFFNTRLEAAVVHVFNGTMKRNYLRDGIAGVETYILTAGSITARPTTTINDQDGNALREYVLMFRSVRRNI